jgi:hypothetical protein
MSKIYFHSKDCDDAEVHGSERAYMSCIINDLTLSVLSDYLKSDHRNPKAQIVNFIKNPNNLYFINYDNNQFEESFKMSFKSGIGNMTFLHNDKEINSFALSLNTAFSLGSDVIQLMARLHAQCEVHTYIKPENFHWMARIIDKGLKLNILRKDQGWESVVTLLETSKEPIVTSFSVCEQFPSAELANWYTCEAFGNKDECICEDQENCEYHDWDEVDFKEQWELSLEKLENKNGCLELTPNGWEGYFFDQNISAFDIISSINEKT